MRRFFYYCIMFFFVTSLFSNTIDLGNYNSQLDIFRSDEYGFDLEINISRIVSFDVLTEQGEFTQIDIPQATFSQRPGEPRLPVIRKLFTAPVAAKVDVRAENYIESVYRLADYGIINPILPSQLPVPKCEDAVEIEFQFKAKVYETDNYNEYPLVSVEEIGSIRGVRIFALNVQPVNYNPVTGEIKVFNNISVSAEFTGGNYPATVYLREKAFSSHFMNLYNSNLINSNILVTRDVLTRYPVKYVIISDPMFENQLQPFIEWKIQKGFDVIEAYTGQPNVGNSPTEIKNFLQSLWDAATPDDPAPTFVLFVGDVQQIPAWSGSTGSHVTDLNYVKLDGPNFLPDMYYGRFSAQNTTDLQPQIDKTMMYEKYEMPDPSYLEDVVMIAGMDGTFSSVWANGQINYGTENYFNAAHGITSHTYLYPSSGSNSAQIIQDVSNGVGYVNYTAHGSSTSWSDPSFTISDINGLQNNGKYPLVVGNCCLTNKFEVGTCFGEAWLRAENKGAIGYIGGTNSTYWDEDYWWGVGAGTITVNPSYETSGLGVYDGLFHDHGEPFEDWFTSTGAMIYRGNLSVTEGGSGMINYYWEIYSVMGDPSLEAYLGVPGTNLATYPNVIFLGLDQIQISAEPYSYVSLVKDGVIHGTALIDDSGVVNLQFEPFLSPGMASIVISRQNKIPVIDEIEVIPAGGPYIIVQSFETTDDNNNIPEYNETVSLNMNFENVGIDPATNVSATLTTTDSYITITSAYTDIGNFSAGEIVNIENAFEIAVAADIPDQRMIAFIVQIQGSDTWNSTIHITFNAPDLQPGVFVIDDAGGNGMLDPGENATILIPIINNGNAVSPEIFVSLTNASPDEITLLTDSYQIVPLTQGAEEWAEFDLIVADDVQPGTIINLGLLINAGQYVVTQTIFPTIGLLLEDFETGDFSQFAWQMGSYGWEITSNNVFEGSYSAKSATISHNQSSTISLVTDVPTNGTISFYRKVSSESNYDYLRFYINGTQQAQWAGEVSWSEVSFPVSAGTNVEFKWSYEKDYSVSTGSDCGWIDYITFPGIGGTEMPIINVSLDNIDFGEVLLEETATAELSLYNLGTIALTGNISTPPGFLVYLPTRDELDFELLSGEYLTVIIEFDPEEAIFYSGNIEIISNDPNQPIIEIPVQGTGIGLNNGSELVPTVTELYGNYPNPFNPVTNISYGLKKESKIKLTVYNIRGQKVATLINAVQPAGFHNIRWAGLDEHGKQVTSGVYFYEMFVDDSDYTSVKKMILLK